MTDCIARLPKGANILTLHLPNIYIKRLSHLQNLLAYMTFLFQYFVTYIIK
jgi:hypothetical protein